jgi:hypothetical protein
MQLNEKKIKAAKPEAKRRRFSDGHGLYLDVMPSGAKFWRQGYRNAQGLQRTYTLGEYPHLGLAAARARLAEVKQAVREGGDPAQEARAVPVEEVEAAEAVVTFGEVGRAYIVKRGKEGVAKLTMTHLVSHFGRLDAAFGSTPAREVTPKMVLAVFRASREVSRGVTMGCRKPQKSPLRAYPRGLLSCRYLVSLKGLFPLPRDLLVTLR